MTVTNYLWDDENITLEFDDTDTTLAEYTYEPELYGNLISERREGETYQHNYDALGSTRTLTDTSGRVTDTYTYTAFGESVSSSGTTTNPFRYVGEKGYYFDEETDDYYVRERTYQPSIAQWTAVDSLFNELNEGRYAYVLNRPTVLTDQSGKRCEANAAELQYIDPIRNELPQHSWALVTG